MPTAPPMHRPPGSERRKQQTGWKDTSRHSRGYGNDWYKLRNRIMDRDRKLCQPCKRKGYMTPAKQVDHIQPRSQGGTEEDCNLEAICLRCHVLKTAKERAAARANAPR